MSSCVPLYLCAGLQVPDSDGVVGGAGNQLLPTGTETHALHRPRVGPHQGAVAPAASIQEANVALNNWVRHRV